MDPILFDGIAFRFFTTDEVAAYFAGVLPCDFVVIVTPLRQVPPDDETEMEKHLTNNQSGFILMLSQ